MESKGDKSSGSVATELVRNLNPMLAMPWQKVTTIGEMEAEKGFRVKSALRNVWSLSAGADRHRTGTWPWAVGDFGSDVFQ